MTPWPFTHRRDTERVEADLEQAVAERRRVADRSTVVTRVSERFRTSRDLRRATREQIKARIDERGGARERAAAAFASFSASRASSATRARSTYVGPQDSLGASMDAVRQSAVESLHARGAKGAGLKLDLSAAAKATLGIPLDMDPGDLSSVDVDALSEWLLDRIGSWDLFADESLMAACRARETATDKVGQLESRLADTGAETDGGATAAGGAPADVDGAATNGAAAASAPADATSFAAGGIARLMDSVTSPEERVQFGAASRAAQEDVARNAASLELRGGPADVTSYHDFHHLQIAFEHVWTEVFDGELAQRGKELFEEMVVLEDYGVSTDLDTVDSVEQLKRLRADVGRAFQQIAGSDARFGIVRALVPDLTFADWATFGEDAKDELMELAEKYEKETEFTLFGAIKLGKPISEEMREAITAQAKAIVESERRQVGRLAAMLQELDERLAEPYSFSVYAPGSYNYGILVNYRQAWKPLNYQVGELVKTIPLAPKEKRKYAVERVLKTTRAEKEVESALSIRRGDSSLTSRDASEIVRRASRSSNFTFTAEGGVSTGMFSAKATATQQLNAARQSAESKKAFREAVVKAAEEYRQERRLQIETTAAEESSEAESAEIQNPNDELSVTYLFYELQRRYSVSERIHSATPVILVANEVPAPNEVDEDWLVAHDWILRRTILDDSFLPALDYLSEAFVGDEVSTEVLRGNLSVQVDVVKRVTQQIESHMGVLAARRAVLDAAVEAHAQSKSGGGGLFGSITSFLFGSSGDSDETRRLRMEAARETFERAERRQQDLREQLRSEMSALQVATDKYSQALSDQSTRRAAITRLRVHVKENILYYMQAIWDHEPPDQRFFRLHDRTVKVIDGTVGPSTVPVALLVGAMNVAMGNPSGAPLSGTITFPAQVKVSEKALVEVADLDRLLGYKGNLMIFPLKEPDFLSLYMLQDYLDVGDVIRVRDPDVVNGSTTDELVDLAHCYYSKRPHELTDEVKQQLEDALVEKLTSGHAEEEEIVVPTDSLYIESLAGTHPILEDFKLVHRAVDVKDAQAKVRRQEIENVRLAARDLSGDWTDPDVDKRVVIESDGEVGVGADV